MFFKDAHERSLPGTYNQLYQTAEQGALKGMYLREALDQISDKTWRVSKSQDIQKYVIHHLAQSRTPTPPVNILVRQHAKIAIHKVAKFHYRNCMKMIPG